MMQPCKDWNRGDAAALAFSVAATVSLVGGASRI
jgi:hypothetical protein